ncbi:MAG: DNA alkylation repair protein [Bacteroidaceae bacterium]|nr:DNA alkylation repair protein [Bacteroidaceae bacterium]
MPTGNSTSTSITERLFALQDENYATFQRKLLPTVAPDAIIGVRTPALRSLAKEILRSGDADSLISTLPHRYFEENQLHAFILSEMKNFDTCLREVEAFLPYVDNWATCDQLSPRCFRRNKDALFTAVGKWLTSEHTYTVRFAVGMLMSHFLDADFQPSHLSLVASIRRDDYYVRMMQAWYFATALAKQWDATLPYLRCDTPTNDASLEEWTRLKAIQKAIESYRITPAQKDLLRSLR